MTRWLRTVALVAAVAACSSPTTVDVASLVEQLPEAVAPGAPETVTDVECGDELPLGEGLRTTCRANLAGSPISLEVTQLDEAANLSVEIDRTLVDVGELADALADRFTDDLDVATSVVCEGPPLLVADDGRVIDCAATDPGGTVRPLIVTLVDSSGGYRVELG